MNAKLLQLQRQWLAVCHADDMAKKYRLSRPFLFAVTEQYQNSDRRIMIVGQEAKDYASDSYLKENRARVKNGESADDFGAYGCDWQIPEIQRFNVEYTDTQLGRADRYKRNRSPFWKLFRALDANGFATAWNNLDKFHLFRDARTEPLTFEIESVFSKPYGKDHKSLLQREIELTAPRLVLFVTGPKYYKSMATALGVEGDALWDARPRRSAICANITRPGAPTTLWTYHPAYLQRIRALDEAVGIVASYMER